MNMSIETKVAQTAAVLGNAAALTAAICEKVLGAAELGSYQNVTLGGNQIITLAQTVIEAELSKKMGA